MLLLWPRLCCMRVCFCALSESTLRRRLSCGIVYHGGQHSTKYASNPGRDCAPLHLLKRLYKCIPRHGCCAHYRLNSRGPASEHTRLLLTAAERRMPPLTASPALLLQNSSSRWCKCASRPTRPRTLRMLRSRSQRRPRLVRLS